MREKQSVQAIRRGVRVMKWTLGNQYLYGFQTNLFRYWQRFGNISGITR